MRAGVLVFGSAAVASAIACGAFGTDPVAASPDEDAGVADHHAPPPRDGGVAGARFCATADAQLCLDFDGDPVGPWAPREANPLGENRANAGTVTIAPADGGAELVAELPASGPANDAVGMKTIAIPGGRGVEVRADVLIESPAQTYATTSTSIAFLTLQFGDDPIAWGLFSGNPAHATAYGRVAGKPHVALASGSLPYDEWVRLRFRADAVGDGDGRVEVGLVDGEPPATVTIPRTAPIAGTTTLAFGAARYAPNSIPTPLRVHIDNITVDPL